MNPKPIMPTLDLLAAKLIDAARDLEIKRRIMNGLEVSGSGIQRKDD